MLSSRLLGVLPLARPSPSPELRSRAADPVSNFLSCEIEFAAKQIAAKHGLEFTRQRASFTRTDLTTRLLLRVSGTAEQEEMIRAETFPVLAARYGLPADAVGKTFLHRGYTFTVTGLKPERPKYPVSCRRSDGKPFKFPALTVRNKLEEAGCQRLSSGSW